MKWVTREKAKVDRIACPWLIKKFVDKSPEFLFVPPETIPQVVKDTGAIAYDAKGVELTHYKENGEERVSFDAIVKKYKLTDPALLELAKKRAAPPMPPPTPNKIPPPLPIPRSTQWTYSTPAMTNIFIRFLTFLA